MADKAADRELMESGTDLAEPDWSVELIEEIARGIADIDAGRIQSTAQLRAFLRKRREALR